MIECELASETITADLDLEIKEGSEFVIKETKNDQDLLGNISDKRIKDLKTELRKSKEKNSALQDDKIELFEKIAQEKQKNDALEEIISQKEKNVQIACTENTRMVLEKRKLEEILKVSYLRRKFWCLQISQKMNLIFLP